MYKWNLNNFVLKINLVSVSRHAEAYLVNNGKIIFFLREANTNKIGLKEEIDSNITN